MNIICIQCLAEKDEIEFNKNYRFTNRKPFCKICERINARKYHALNKNKRNKLIILARKERKKELKQFIFDYKKNKACKDCGIKYHPFAMDFDHLDGDSNLDNISVMVCSGTASKSRVLKEIDKCDLVCANCHRIRTYNRLKEQYPNMI